VKTLEPDGEKARTLLLAMAAQENSGVRDVVGKKLKTKEPVWRTDVVLRRLLTLPYSDVKGMILEAVNEKLLQGGSRPYPSGYSDGFGIEERLIVSKFLGIDVGKEFAIDEDYLQKKTKAEIIAFGRKLRILSDPRVTDYIVKKFKRPAGNFEDLKKSQLVEAILKSGVDLVGRARRKSKGEIMSRPMSRYLEFRRSRAAKRKSLPRGRARN
jgi:hypothetical protein